MYYQRKYQIYGGIFDIDNKKILLDKDNSLMSMPNFWDNRDNADKIVKEVSNLKKQIDNIENVNISIKNNIDIINSINDNDVDILELLEMEYNDLLNKVSEMMAEHKSAAVFLSNSTLFSLYILYIIVAVHPTG